MAYCPQCDEGRSDSDTFCSECGAKLTHGGGKSGRQRWNRGGCPRDDPNTGADTDEAAHDREDGPASRRDLIDRLDRTD